MGGKWTGGSVDEFAEHAPEYIKMAWKKIPELKLELENFTTVVYLDTNKTNKNVFGRFDWLTKNIGENKIDWRYLAGGFWLFKKGDDATLFKLTWG